MMVSLRSEAAEMAAREAEELCLAYARTADVQLRARTEGESMFVDLSFRGLICDLLRIAWRKVSRNARVRAEARDNIGAALYEYRNALDALRAKLETIGDTLATIRIMVRDGERGAEFDDACERVVALVTELQGTTGAAGIAIEEIGHLVMSVTKTF